MNVLNLKTGEPFDPLPRLHHRHESPLAVSSSENSGRARGMLLGAKSFYIGGAAKWKNPYVSDGLVAMWDGEWNAGGGVHDASARLPVDIVGACDVSAYNGVNGLVFNEKTIKFDKNTILVFENIDGYNGLNYTIEIVCTTSDVAYLYRCYGTGKQLLPILYTDKYQPAIMNYANYGSISVTSRVHCFSQVSSDVYGNGTLGTYIDGEHSRDDSFPSGTKTFHGTIHLGGRIDSQSYRYGGYFCNMRVYNRPLSSSEIAANYDVDKARFGLT